MFEYLRTPDAATRWNMVRNQVGLQFQYIERDLGVPDLQGWWNEFVDDYFITVQRTAQGWALQAIDAAAGRYQEAQTANLARGGPGLQTYQQVMATLSLLRNEIAQMQLPPSNGGLIPQPPGGAAGDGSGFS